MLKGVKCLLGTLMSMNYVGCLNFEYNMIPEVSY